MLIKRLSIGVLFVALAFGTASAQQYLDPEYIKVTKERGAKIVDGLELNDPAKEEAVTEIIAKQYQNLSKLQDERDAKIEDVKKSDLAKDKQDKKIEKAKAKSEKSIDKLHKSYVKQLSSQLTEEQVDGVKDGMTYGVLPKTYKAFLEMIPTLSKEEQDYIYNNLKEAREHAMDGGSSKEKHAWFGKYKGRINNYLSARGYDLEKERDGWYQRIEEAKKK
ncbi:DUF3826 domain-containing protein [Aestuariibaculum lutulentum]|uniref:DUF3826 domain-containing protein n=1 Tax=Aestuariibaculum lutulentum TaxID=2920935 RepID=A0ABS9RFF3_9FLAO|nr:DUF3826 domain-containing protein [Aestuariibaculum lutulentum]MCH4551663.1 DUF3826 domain-containing protein [Aestuariibaculum lutulentum]